MENNISASWLRSKWIEFFKNKGHLDVSNKSICPISTDKSLLFINSGVSAIKDYFYGDIPSPSKRLVSCQKVIRTGDIDSIGYSLRHNTYFEMLGNFSIGDYFKKEAIEWAWEFLIQELGFKPTQLYVTIFEKDIEALNEWKKWISEERILLCSRDTNFWDMGVGPCGPCTEIYFDKGEEYDIRGAEILKKNIENNRYVEIWNIVFSEYLNIDGKLLSSPTKNIDTGAGLERLLAILEHKDNNFGTSLFVPISDYLASKGELIGNKLWAPADFFRTSCLLVNDGICFGNKGREYVLRKIFRRAIYLLIGYTFNRAFFTGLVDVISSTLSFYSWNKKRIVDVFCEESSLVSQTINTSSKYLYRLLDVYKKHVPEQEIFNLVTRYGLDYSYILTVLLNENRTFDKDKYEDLIKKHKEASINTNISSAFIKKYPSLLELDVSSEMNYLLDSTNSSVVALFDLSFNRVSEIIGRGYIVLDTTVIFPLSSGQDSDEGFIDNKQVYSSLRGPNGQILHEVEGSYSIGSKVEVKHNKNKRKGLEIHHTLEHLLYELLKREVSSDIVRSSGFKYSNYATLEITVPAFINKNSFNLTELSNKLSKLVNTNLDIFISYITLDEAKNMNLSLNFEEVYKKTSNKLRLVNIGEYSKELCAGTHVSNTSQIKNVFISECKKKQSNIYKLKIIGGDNAKEEYKKLYKTKEVFSKQDIRSEFLVKKNLLIHELLNNTDKLLVIERDIDSTLAASALKEIRSRIHNRTIVLLNNYRFFIVSDSIDLNKVFVVLRKYGWKCGGNTGFGSGMGTGEDFRKKLINCLELNLN